MKQSRRARRMHRRHAQAAHDAELNLTSMTDFFTVLVTVLLVYSLHVQMLPTPENMVLPTSTATENLHQKAVAIMLTHDGILVNGEPVIGYQQMRTSDSQTIPALTAALLQAAPERAQTPSARGRVAIMADKELPFRLIRKVMVTTTAAEFSRISLAVLQEDQ